MIPRRQDKPDEAFVVLALHDWDALYGPSLIKTHWPILCVRST